MGELKKIRQQGRGSFSLVEMIVVVGIMSLLILILMKMFSHDAMLFSELEHRLAGQGDSRLALEFLYRDLSGAYRIEKIDPQNGEIEIVTSSELPTELAESLRGEDPAIGKIPNKNELFLNVQVVHYYFKGKTVTPKGVEGKTMYRKVTPGKFYLLDQKVQTAGASVKDTLILRHVERMNWEPFKMLAKGQLEKVNTAASQDREKIAMLHLKLKLTHFEQEAGALDLAMNFYCRPIISLTLYPGYFNTIDKYVDF